MLVVTPFFAKQLGAQGFDPLDSPVSGQHTSGVMARVDIGAYPVGSFESEAADTHSALWQANSLKLTGSDHGLRSAPRNVERFAA
jgi:hypothetical protein